MCETKWNHHVVAPGKRVCISPIYGTGKNKRENRVFVPDIVEQVISDSGAFSDDINKRLSFGEALKRQLKHIDKYNYWYKLYKLATYDVLIDEKWQNGKRTKERWNENDAKFAVDETIRAAEFLNEKRHCIPNEAGLVLSLQGISVKQYVDCAKRIMPFFNPEKDTIGFGGWCIIGKMRKRMMPVFIDTIREVVPYLASNNVKHIHIWGVIFPNALGYLSYICNEYNIQLSTDSVGPQLKPCFGSWGYGEWIDKSYKRPDVTIRGLERKKHNAITRSWLNEFEKTVYYRELPENSENWRIKNV